MDAGKKILLDLFTGSLRFVVPVYQRRYSWGEAQCRQLWADIVTAGRHPERTHFTGSIVWMQEGGIGPDGVSRCQLIDGQQRLTSVTLLLIALAEYAREHPESLRFSADMLIDRGYLVDKYATGEGRYKLTLSGDDREVLRSMCDHVVVPDRPNHANTGSRLETNLDLFRSLVAAIDDANVVWNGLQRLEVVSVTLDQGRDEPQLVFESMNSTGLDLETSDLVRNYMLMGCPMVEQNTLYADYWLPMERTLGNLSFDAFLHDWMVVTLKKPVPKGRAMYTEFKRFAASSSLPRMERTRNLLENMHGICQVLRRYQGHCGRRQRRHERGSPARIDSRPGQHGYGFIGYVHVRGVEAPSHKPRRIAAHACGSRIVSVPPNGLLGVQQRIEQTCPIPDSQT